MNPHNSKTLPDISRRWLRKFLNQEKLRFSLVLLLNFIGVALALIQPYPLKLLADSVFGHSSAFWPINNIHDRTTLLYIAALSIFVIAIVTGLYSLGTGLLQQRIEMRLSLQVQRELLAAVLDTPLRARE